jgi:hypothetical protein
MSERASLPLQAVAERLRRLDAGLTEAEAAEAERNLAGFVALLARVDGEATERGSEHDGDGSGHRVRQGNPGGAVRRMTAAADPARSSAMDHSPLVSRLVD